MKEDQLSLRQIAVLTVTGLLSPAAELLPRLAAGTAGRAGWLAPLFALPFFLGWILVMTGLCSERASDFSSAARKGLGRIGGHALELLYIMWGTVLLAAQLDRSSFRLGAVYGLGVGRVLSALVLALTLWMVWGRVSALCRAAELFWLAMAVVVAGLLALSLPQVKPERLWPGWEEWKQLPRAGLDCLGVFAPAVFAGVLAGKAPRTATARRRLVGWGAALCLLAALLSGAVIGQVGAELTVKLPRPFFIMVQGLSLQGTFARMEAPVASVWLLANFAQMGLLLAAIRQLAASIAGTSAGKWVAAAAAVLAVLGQTLFPRDAATGIPGLVLGIGLPCGLWLVCRVRERRGKNSTSCGNGSG